MDDLPETADEYMMFLLKLINNFLLDHTVPEWFSIKKLTLDVEPDAELEPEKETE